jgi:hypothetical protein
MKKFFIGWRTRSGLLIALALVSCASPTPNANDSRQSVRRKPGPNLDRKYDWGSMPPPGPMRTHSSD